MLVRAIYEVTIVFNRKNPDDIPAEYIKERLNLPDIIIENVVCRAWDEVEPKTGEERKWQRRKLNPTSVKYAISS